MEITYNTSRSDQWRCHLYVMFHRPQALFSQLLVPALFSFWFLPFFKGLGTWAFPSALLVSLITWTLLLALILQVMILKRLPTPTSRRTCTTVITPEFFRDIVPEKVMEYRWTQISEIRLHQCDFYFWLGGNKGNFIPRSAFENPREAQLFFETAMYYWRSAKSGQAASPLQDESVWPPAPRSGA